MWIQSKAGFYSCVADWNNKNHIVVRARVRKDINRLRVMYMPELGDTLSTPKNDYPFRAKILKKNFEKGLAKMAMDVDYGNFKSEIGRVQGREREEIYHQVWAVLFKLEKMHMNHPEDIRPVKKISWLDDCSPEEIAQFTSKGYYPVRSTDKPDPNVIPGKDVVRSRYVYRNGRQYVRDQYGNEELVKFEPLNPRRD